MNADQLLEAAAIVACTHSHGSRVLAADMREEANAANGYGTRATLQLSIALDNDREHAAHVREIMLGIPLYLSYTLEDARQAQASHIADALREYCNGACGFEPDGIHNENLSPIMLAMIRVALDDVDWTGLAKHYIEQEEA